jgi:hypothetical protein
VRRRAGTRRCRAVRFCPRPTPFDTRADKWDRIASNYRLLTDQLWNIADHGFGQVICSTIRERTHGIYRQLPKCQLGHPPLSPDKLGYPDLCFVGHVLVTRRSISSPTLPKPTRPRAGNYSTRKVGARKRSKYQILPPPTDEYLASLRCSIVQRGVVDAQTSGVSTSGVSLQCRC